MQVKRDEKQMNSLSKVGKIGFGEKKLHFRYSNKLGKHPCLYHQRPHLPIIHITILKTEKLCGRETSLTSFYLTPITIWWTYFAEHSLENTGKVSPSSSFQYLNLLLL